MDVRLNLTRYVSFFSERFRYNGHITSDNGSGSYASRSVNLLLTGKGFNLVEEHKRKCYTN